MYESTKDYRKGENENKFHKILCKCQNKINFKENNKKISNENLNQNFNQTLFSLKGFTDGLKTVQ